MASTGTVLSHGQKAVKAFHVAQMNIVLKTLISGLLGQNFQPPHYKLHVSRGCFQNCHCCVLKYLIINKLRYYFLYLCWTGQIRIIHFHDLVTLKELSICIGHTTSNLGIVSFDQLFPLLKYQFILIFNFDIEAIRPTRLWKLLSPFHNWSITRTFGQLNLTET